MKNLRSMSIVMASVLLALTAGIVFSDRSGTAEETEKATLNLTMQVKGMTCSGCASAIQSALKQVPGVLKADVSFDKNEAYVEYRKGKTTPEELVKAVEKAGYKASIKGEKDKKSHSGER